MGEGWPPGRVVAIREMWHGLLWSARPAIVVRDAEQETMLHVPPRVPVIEPVDDGDLVLRIPKDRWRLRHAVGWDRRVLSFAFPRTPYAVLYVWNSGDRFEGWYVNLQAPLARSEVGFDTTDHVLDVVISPDRSSWGWKDEAELAEAIDAGSFTPANELGFRSAGERAVERILMHEPPFDEPWEDWRPDPGWGRATLPPGWEGDPSGD